MSRRDEREAENATLIRLLRVMNDPVARELASRMARCRDTRITRRAAGIVTVTDAIRAGPGWRCKTVACWSCRTSHVKRKRTMAIRLFSGQENKDLSLVTINAGRGLSSLREVTLEHEQFAKDLTRLRKKLLRTDQRLAGITALAVLEVTNSGGLWKPHWHIVLAHPEIDRDEIVSMLRERFPGNRRVNIKAFHSERASTDNVEGCVSYALKSDHGSWSPHDVALYYRWMRGRCALRSLCILLNARESDHVALV